MTQKIGFLGSDNSHLERFGEILNLEDHPSYWPDSGAQVWAVWGEDPERTKKGAANVRIPVVADSPEQVVEECDMVFVITRSAGLHLDLARPVIEARKPLFVEKPLTQTPNQARELLGLVEASGVNMTSFSTLRYGSAARLYREGLDAAGPVRYASYVGPATRRNPYGGILFYAIHVVELMNEFHGPDVVSVRAVESPPDADKSNIAVACTLGDGTLVSLALVGDGTYFFYMMAVGQDGMVEVPGTTRNYAEEAAQQAHEAGSGGATPGRAVDNPAADHYENGMREILSVLRGEKPSGVSHEDMLRSIQVCAAIEESLQRNAPIDPRTL
jgi:predicted dehydrogenase